ncbi:MAG TPA: hypothetical protein VJ831_02485, partial [Jatrophihabitantaceae bacterium]|nr:hypothetical protein [Jatrophihabitantaceae bacterium]
MTLLDEAPRQTGVKPRRPRIIWVFGGLALILLLVGLTGGSYLGKLGDVQKNDNSSWLPGSADSTKVANEQEKFSTIQSVPGFILYQRKGGLTAADKQKIAADRTAFKNVKGVSADELGLPAFSNNGEVAAI